MNIFSPSAGQTLGSGKIRGLNLDEVSIDAQCYGDFR
jgi:hypothetical protein